MHPCDSGRAEARRAGEILKLHGIELDVVYTSWLSRSIETAWIILNELDSMWLPIIKTWRLNERMVLNVFVCMYACMYPYSCCFCSKLCKCEILILCMYV
jgi:hypothetical protein